jgi:hypothetical protein
LCFNSSAFLGNIFLQNVVFPTPGAPDRYTTRVFFATSLLCSPSCQAECHASQFFLASRNTSCCCVSRFLKLKYVPTSNGSRLSGIGSEEPGKVPRLSRRGPFLLRKRSMHSANGFFGAVTTKKLKSTPKKRHKDVALCTWFCDFYCGFFF